VVFLRAAGAFFSAKMTFLGFLGHVLALLKPSYVPQALFFGKNEVPEIFRTCNLPVGVFLRAAGAFFVAKMTFLRFSGHVISLLGSFYVPQALFFRQAVTHKWLWLYL
jgi:hypothetical protein